MKHLLALAVIATLIFAGCTAEDSSTGSNSSTAETVNIGLSKRQYQYAEVFNEDGTLYKLHYVYNGSLVDTMFVDVPAVDTISVIFHNNGAIEFERVHPVADSVYWFRF